MSGPDAMMRAVEIAAPGGAAPGGAEMLRPTMRPIPEPGPGEIRIKLGFAGVNRPDVLQRAGLYAPPADASDLPGLEGAGRVDALGPGVLGWRIGAPVCALLPGGGYAEYALAPARHCLPVPAGLTAQQAACLPETYFTVWSNLIGRAGLRAGERLLVHGGSSGIGTTAIQLASALGARVFATAGSAEKCAACAALGAERAINYKDEDFGPILRAEGGADVILDMVGGSYIARNLKGLAPEGRLVQIAFLEGAQAEINLAPLMLRRQMITGSTLRAQSLSAKAAIAEALGAAVWPMLETGRLALVLDSCFALEDAAAAHRRMEAGAHIGKIALSIAPDILP